MQPPNTPRLQWFVRHLALVLTKATSVQVARLPDQRQLGRCAYRSQAYTNAKTREKHQRQICWPRSILRFVAFYTLCCFYYEQLSRCTRDESRRVVAALLKKTILLICELLIWREVSSLDNESIGLSRLADILCK